MVVVKRFLIQMSMINKTETIKYIKDEILPKEVVFGTGKYHIASKYDGYNACLQEVHSTLPSVYDYIEERVREEMNFGEFREYIKKLRDTPNWSRETYGDYKNSTSVYDRTPFEVADMLEKRLSLLQSKDK